MTDGTIHRELQRLVIGVCGAIIIRSMATGTGIGRVDIIPLVTGITVHRNIGVCSVQRIKTVMVKGGGSPGRFCVAGSTIGRELRSHVVGISGAIVIRSVTTGTGIGGSVVIAVMAGCAIICDACVRSV